MNRVSKATATQARGSAGAPAPEAGETPSNRRVWIILALILAAGLLLRVGYLREVTSAPIFNAPMADAAFHDYWARGLVSGEWAPPPGEPDPRVREVPFLRPPGYPYFLALLYAITGKSLTGTRAIQMLLGLVNAWLAFLLGRATVNRAVGLILAGFTATYWVFIYYEMQLHSIDLSILLGLLTLLVMNRWLGHPRWQTAFLAGVLLGLSALVRPEVLLFAPAAAGWMWWNGRRRRGIRPLATELAALTAGCVALVSVATVRNFEVAHEFCLISSNAAVNYYVGNNETADGITTRMPILPEITGGSGWSCFSYDQIVSAIGRHLGRKMNYAQASAYFSGLARQYIEAHPGGFLRLCLRRAALYWDPHEVANNRADDMEKKASPSLRFLPGFAAVFSISLVGLGLLIADRRSSRGARGRAHGAPGAYSAPMLALIGLYIVTSFLAVLPFIVAGRLRAPVIPFVFLFGAFALHRLWGYLSARAWKPAAVAAGIWVALFFTARVSFAGYSTDPAWWHTDRAVALQQNGRKDEALAEYQAALAANPGFVDAHVNLAGLLAQTGRLDEAIAHYQQVVTNRPQRVDVRQMLGMALLERGRAADAARELQEVVRQNPRLADGWFQLARALMDTHDYAGSVEASDRCLALTPDEPGAFVNRGIALMRMGRPADAVASLTRALQINPDLTVGYLWLGEAEMATGDLDKAESAFREALRRDSKSPAPLINLARAAARRGRMDDAVNWFRRAIQLDPRNISAHYNLAATYAQAGRTAEARSELQEVLRIDPANPLAKSQLEKLDSGGAR